MKLRAAMTKTSPNDASCVASVRLGPGEFFSYHLHTNSQDNLKYITMYYVDFEIKFDPLFTI